MTIADGAVLVIKEIGNVADGSHTGHNELKIMKEIQNCQTIVRLEESFERNAKLFIVMEYCDKGDLKNYL